MAPRLEAAKSNVTNEAIAQFAIEADQAQREIDEASGRKRAVLKRAKGAGVNTKALLTALGMKRDDEERVRLDMRDTIRYAHIVAPAVKMSQDDLFGGFETRALKPKVQAQVQAWEAEQEGYTAGLNGGDRSDSRFPEGSPGSAQFFKGFLRGQSVIAARMGPDEKKASASLVKNRDGKMAAAGDEGEGMDQHDGQTDLEDHTRNSMAHGNA